MSEQASAKEPTERLSADIVRISQVTAVAGVVGGIALIAQEVAVRPAAILLAFACLLGGGLIGFLFGIPRVLQEDERSTERNGQPPSAANGDDATTKAGSRYRQQVNTNLEQISDWLTKIIVGFGLIELRRLPTALQQAAASVASGIAVRPCATATCDSARTLALSVIVYFVLLGFLSGYLLTRLYLAVAFRRADEVSLLGERTSMPKATELLGKLVSDLLGRVTELGTKQSAVNASAVAGPPSNKSPTRSVLWVDDNPINNRFVVDQLERAGISVMTALTTSEATQLLPGKTFDWILTDMHRIENGKEAPTAGLDFIREARKLGVSTPIIVHCGRGSMIRYGEKAKAAGASEVTDSPTQVLALLMA